MTQWWAQYAWLGGDRAETGVLLETDGNRIVGVQTGVVEPPRGAGRLPGLTLPGLVNSHSHAFHRALRGRTHAGRGSFWNWREQMYALADRLDVEPAGPVHALISLNGEKTSVRLWAERPATAEQLRASAPRVETVQALRAASKG